MRMLLLCLVLSGCHLDKLLRTPEPSPVKTCYMNAYYVRHYAGVTDTVWLGSTEIPCK